MGCFPSKPSPAEIETENKARAVSEKINREQQESMLRDSGSIKLLLLGAGDGGKTTLRKQMRNLYGSGFDESTRREYIHVIVGGLIEGTKDILTAMKSQFGVSIEDNPVLQSSYDTLFALKDYSTLSSEVAGAVNALLTQPDFMAVVNGKTAKFQLQDCWSTFAEQCKDYPKWGGDKWIPSVSDCIAARVRTSGIQEEQFELDRIKFRVFDVGGQRAERRKWINCFDNVTSVIFVAAISEYDQVLFEDPSKNRVEEAVELFDEICGNKVFTKIPIILFLNKRDLFEKKFVVQQGWFEYSPNDVDEALTSHTTSAPRTHTSSVPLNASGTFPTAPKTNDVKKALEWLTNLFTERATTHKKKIFTHVTTATDPNNIRNVFEACKNILLSQSMESSGFALDS